MDQHPMPRQITTFEFKLIGFLTLKQFIYLAVFIPLGYLFYKLFPLPLLNIFVGLLVGGAGLALAFVPVNDRPLDVWIKNLYRRLTSPTQYIYHKQNQPIYFLRNLFFLSDPHRIMTHVESQEKLAAYLASTKPKTIQNTNKQNISQILQTPSQSLTSAKRVDSASILSRPQNNALNQKETTVSISKPFFTGEIKNHKLIPLPGILIYIKNNQGKLVRLLKTNPHGVFATFRALPQGDYNMEPKDPKQTYFFDTMKIKIAKDNPRPFEIFSKELI